MFWNKKKKIEKEEYDRSQYTPAIRSSICTGEKTGGLIRNVFTKAELNCVSCGQSIQDRSGAAAAILEKR